MSSLHVNLTVSHGASMPHMPCALDPQMRVFYQRNLDPFESSLSMTDLFRAAGNLLSVARSSLSWARQFLPGREIPKPGPRRAKSGKEKEEGSEPPEDAKPPGRESKPVSEQDEKASPPAAKDSLDEEAVRRTREAGRRATAQAQETLRRAGKKESARRTEGTAPLAKPSRDYGVRLALELSLGGNRPKEPERGEGDPSRGRPRKEEEEASRRGEPFSSGFKNFSPTFSVQASLNVPLPAARSSAAGRGGRGGR
ncbi:MAG: hypothetical protein AB7T14_07785 [Candidatus Methylacidiphilaceae bacterium]